MSSAPTRKIAVVIAAWKAVPFLDDCLNSLAAADTTGLEMRVFLVDDESPDETAAYTQEHWPWVSVCRLDRNSGFAGANNHGIRQAMQWGADYVYLLNQDTAVDPGFLREAVALADAEPRTGAVQSLLLLHERPELVNSWGNAIHYLGFGYSLGYKRPRSEAPTKPVDIIYPSGAAVLLRVTALEQVGLLDESLYMYHEDLDLGWRLRLAGWQNRLAPQSVVYHKYEFSRSISKFYYMERNRYLVLFQNLRLWSLIVLAPVLVAVEFGLLLLAAYGGWWQQKLKIYAYFLQPGCWQDISQKRYSIAQLRQVSDRQIMAPFVSDISFQEVDSPFSRYLANPAMRLAWRLIKPLII